MEAGREKSEVRQSARTRNLCEIGNGPGFAVHDAKLPPNTPKDRVRILVEAMRRAISDPGYHKDYAKLSGVAPTPVTAEEQSKAIREIPRDPEIIALYKKLAGPDPMPSR